MRAYFGRLADGQGLDMWVFLCRFGRLTDGLGLDVRVFLCESHQQADTPTPLQGMMVRPSAVRISGNSSTMSRCDYIPNAASGRLCGVVL